jgi:hypothetical protein
LVARQRQPLPTSQKKKKKKTEKEKETGFALLCLVLVGSNFELIWSEKRYLVYFVMGNGGTDGQ